MAQSNVDDSRTVVMPINHRADLGQYANAIELEPPLNKKNRPPKIGKGGFHFSSFVKL